VRKLRAMPASVAVPASVVLAANVLPANWFSVTGAFKALLSPLDMFLNTSSSIMKTNTTPVTKSGMLTKPA